MGARQHMEDRNNDNKEKNWRLVDSNDLDETAPDDEVESHDHVIMSLRMALAGYRHDLKKINEAYEKNVVDAAMWKRVTQNLESHIKEYQNAINIIKEWEDE